MIGSFRAELFRMIRWPALWVLVSILLVLNLTFGYLLSYVGYRGEENPAVAAVMLDRMLPDNVPAALAQGLPLFGGALVLVLAALAVGSGYGWGTWKAVFTLGPGRLTAFGGTLAALVVVVVGLTLALFGFDLAAASLVAAAENAPSALPGASETLRGVGGGALILAMWAAAGVLIGTLTRAPALAIGIGLVWAMVVENLLRSMGGLIGWLEPVTDMLPGSAAGSVAAALSGVSPDDLVESAPGVAPLLAGVPAAFLLAGYMLAFITIAATLVRRRDLAM